ncbi:aspartate aminotransferase, mitochondrial-like isoform X2 [Alnus glutinosa]|uniref:aspartate aminotransferase, mitochondrial-like isoform X2 n=1 Tax=Alnus glutinosa TaxID=3517 RepID=UPI002D796A17|nr:aspartate aminotransferase, mitochondrial-like isoform X2 [Alnus glutinosa]
MWRFMGGRFSRSTRCMSSSSRAFGWWEHVSPAPKDPITGVTEAFLADTNPNKINLGVGAYRDDQGKPVVLQCVRNAEAKIAACEFPESNATAVASKLVEESVKLAYGTHAHVVREGRVAGLQALSGTCACRLFAELQRRFYPRSPIYLPYPTWSNHHNIWRDAQVPERGFRYYNPITKGLDFAALMDDVKNAPEGSFFLFHPCAHNPTGVDPTEEQWREISYQFKVKNHFPFFDMAYQGFASGDLDMDAQAIRIFLEDGHLIGCAQSFSKNMGLYGHRVGCLSVLCADVKQAVAVKSQLQKIARAMYSNPPVHGILLVSTILNDPQTKALWIKEVKVMANRIQLMRATLRERLEELGSPLDWEHISNQVGMFCFSGLTPDQVDRLVREFHIYMTRDGRIRICSIGYTANLDGIPILAREK